MPERITLYTAKLCPFAHRVEIALKESGLQYDRCEVDFFNKPDWYIQKVNPAGKVPAIAYGGPEVSTGLEYPSPESTKLFESLILVEFINDLISPPESAQDTAILPKDPVLRAKARFFIEAVCSKLVSAFFNVHIRGQHPSSILSAVETLQELLPKDGGFVLGEDRWSMADVAPLTVLARAEVGMVNDLGAYDEGEGRKAWDRLMSDEKFERFRKWFADAKAKKSFQETFDAEFVLDNFKSMYPAMRAKRLAEKVGA
ncbi:putative glutathione S-transferase [Leucoagaricus sp. SymC.cos]|nr:putative glutathione S-transferase [Leucoagaricus sp. SymC.cos]